MTEREMLEMAAKAAGITIHGWDQYPDGEYADTDPEGKWHPGKSDSDAFRLAVKLGLDITMRSLRNTADPAVWVGPYIHEQASADPYAATRLAILRAAAQIGKGMS
jgi:hypothetical protein